MYELFIKLGEVFLHVFNISIMASWLVLAVLCVRLLLKKAPKWINCFLWAFVGFRLLVPFDLESVFSLIPSSQTIPVSGIYTDSIGSGQSFMPKVDSGFQVVDSVIQPILTETSTQPVMQSNISIIACVWLVGVVALLVYALVSYLKVKKSVAEAIHLKENIYLAEKISTPFILGVIKPKIYIPFSLAEEDVAYVTEHEKAHIKRLDYLWKPLGFLLLALYWFNPVMWVAYIFLCKDIELACDEKVIKDLDTNHRKEYSLALINCSSQRRLVSVCPVAFGETGVKNRIKSVLSFKKPTFWMIIVAVITCIVVAVAFLTSPPKNEETGKNVPDTTQNTQVESTTAPFETNTENTTESQKNYGVPITAHSGNLAGDGTTSNVVPDESKISTQSTTNRLDRNGNGIIEPGELVDFQELLPESELKFGVPEYKLNCEGVVSAKIVNRVLTDELEGVFTEYTETVTDIIKIQAFTDVFNSLLTTSTPDELDTWWYDDRDEDSVFIYLYKSDGSYILVSSVDPWRIRLENNERRKISPYDRKALLDTLYDTEARFLSYYAKNTVHKVDMPDKEFVEKARTVTKDTDWLGFKGVFGKTGDFSRDRGYEYYYIHNGEYILFVEEGYQVYLRKFSDPSFRQKIA